MDSSNAAKLIQTGTQLHASGQLDQAQQIYQQVLSTFPNHADALHLLGIIACQRGDFARGSDLISRALVQAPATGFYHNSLGNAYRGLGRLHDALHEFRTATQLDRSNLEALTNLAMTLDDLDQTTESLRCFDQMMHLRFDSPIWHINRGSAQLNANQTTAAVDSFRKAIALHPDFAAAHAKLSVALLRLGDYQQGWIEAEWRFRTGQVTDPCAGDPAPRWDGSPLAGRSLLIRTEQGFGDAIQFIRYAPLIEKNGGRIIVQCQRALSRMLRKVAGVDEIIGPAEPLPTHDLQLPIVSFPLVFNTTMETIPHRVPYLHASGGGLRLPKSPGIKRIGLAWAGNPNHANDRRRSVDPQLLSILSNLPNLEFHRLQLPTHLPAPPGLQLIDHTNELADFQDTADVIAQLDLVISVDSAIAHLAGAMGKPTWILLPFAAEWRWLEQRSDSPWYPTARLFRQTKPGDWTGVLSKVREAITPLIPAAQTPAPGVSAPPG